MLKLHRKNVKNPGKRCFAVRKEWIKKQKLIFIIEKNSKKHGKALNCDLDLVLVVGGVAQGDGDGPRVRVGAAQVKVGCNRIRGQRSEVRGQRSEVGSQ